VEKHVGKVKKKKERMKKLKAAYFKMRQEIARDSGTRDKRAAGGEFIMT
jgi:hypothetical protein